MKSLVGVQEHQVYLAVSAISNLDGLSNYDKLEMIWIIMKESYHTLTNK